MDSKQSLSKGAAGFCSRCREAGEAVILCTAIKVLQPPAKERDCDHTWGKSCHFQPKTVVLQGAVCPVLLCFAVSMEVVGDFGEEGSGHPACSGGANLLLGYCEDS